MTKACPCCPGDGWVSSVHGQYLVECKLCGLTTRMWSSRFLALKAWNTRIPYGPPSLERIKKQLDYYEGIAGLEYDHPGDARCLIRDMRDWIREELEGGA